MMFKHIAQEPLMHFALAGFLIFQYYSFNQNEVADDANDMLSIHVSETKIAQLSTQFNRINLRPPIEKELQGLIENYIHEEVMYREALTMGLDKNDEQVRKRLKMKIEYLLEDISVVEITDVMLENFLQKNTGKYRTDAILSFQQILNVSGNDWVGPIYSEFGLHIVRINSFRPSRMPTLEEARFSLERNLTT